MTLRTFGTTKKYQSFLNYAIANFQNGVICILLYILFFILLTAYCVFYIVFLLYPRPTAHFLHVYLSYFTNPASWLPQWNKRLSCLVFSSFDVLISLRISQFYYFLCISSLTYFYLHTYMSYIPTYLLTYLLTYLICIYVELNAVCRCWGRTSSSMLDRALIPQLTLDK